MPNYRVIGRIQSGCEGCGPVWNLVMVRFTKGSYYQPASVFSPLHIPGLANSPWFGRGTRKEREAEGDVYEKTFFVLLSVEKFKCILGTA